jgi:hypothetical protein
MSYQLTLDASNEVGLIALPAMQEAIPVIQVAMPLVEAIPAIQGQLNAIQGQLNAMNNQFDAQLNAMHDHFDARFDGLQDQLHQQWAMIYNSHIVTYNKQSGSPLQPLQKYVSMILILGQSIPDLVG